MTAPRSRIVLAFLPTAQGGVADVAVAPSKPDVVWVRTGERTPGRDLMVEEGLVERVPGRMRECP